VEDFLQYPVMKSVVLNPPSKTACRCLFGEPDPKENIRTLKEELQKHYQKFTEKWNIDPENNLVWPGRYQWSVETLTTDNTNNEQSVKCSGPIRNRVIERGNHPYHQTRITDFLRSRRSLSSSTRKSSPVDAPQTETAESSVLHVVPNLS